MGHLNRTDHHQPLTLQHNHCYTNQKTQQHNWSVFNKIFFILLLLCMVAVTTVVVMMVMGLQEKVGDKGQVAGKLSQPREKDEDQSVKQCAQLEYRYKHFRSLKRRHIATIYYLNQDRYYGEVWQQQLRINDVSRYVGVEGEKKPDGWGEMEYQDGSRYTGQWDRGVRAGCGVFIKKGFLS